MNRNLKIGAIALTVVALSAVFGTVAFAADEPEAPFVCEGIGHGGFGGFGGNSEVLTDLLGLTAEELYDLRSEGITLAEIAASKGISEDQVVTALLENRQEILEAAVEAGRLTQEQANLMLQNMEENIRLRIASSIGPGGFGGCHGAFDGEIAPVEGFGGIRGFGGMGMRR